MEELQELLGTYIQEKLLEVMTAVKAVPGHAEDVEELNRLFDAEISAHNEARRYVYLYIGRVMECFFEKGFCEGMSFSDKIENDDK